MKARPRRVEREVARILNELFSVVGKSPVERIPVLGRTGPDISINESGLVIDVKSRKSVPKLILCGQGQIIRMGDLIGFRMSDMMALLKMETVSPGEVKQSIIVQRWFDHMDEWTKVKRVGGITALVLHKSGTRMPIGNSTVIIKENERKILCQAITAL